MIEMIKITKDGEYAIKFLSSLLHPFIESYWVTLSFIRNLAPTSNHPYTTLDHMELKVQLLAETLYDEGHLVYYECCSLETITNSISKLVSLGVVNAKELTKTQSYGNENLCIIKTDEKTAQLLKNLYERISFFKPVVTSVSGFI
jgi:hypothetical protein